MRALTVAPATEAETPACLALLPALRQAGAEFLIARDGRDLVGAAGVTWQHRRTAAGFALDVEVVPAARRRGVGRELVAAARAMVRGEAEGLSSHRPLDETSDAAAFVQACGFAALGREHHFRAEVVRLTDYIAPLATRLRARGHIPDDVRIVPLAEAPLEEVGWLVSAEFGGGPGQALVSMQAAGRAGGLDLEHSLAVMQGERVAGLVLARWAEDGLPVIEAAVVAPEWRGGWANAVLVEAIAAVGVRVGAAEFRFHCDEGVLDTMQLAARTGAVRESTAAWYYLQAAAS